MKTAAVFLDRDDTLIACRELPPAPPPANPGDLVDPALVRLLPGVAAGLGSLRSAGFPLVVITNQGLVARGAGTLETVAAVNARMLELIEREVPASTPRPLIAKVYACPFHPRGSVPKFTREHPWRKPGPGMLFEAARDLDLDLGASWMIGDAERDIEAGINAGLSPERCLRVGPQFALTGVEAAAKVVLSRLAAESGEQSTIRLSALSGKPLEDRATRDTVIASARALAERSGIVIDHLSVRGDSIAVTLQSDRITGVGFAAELRRTTNAWYEGKYHDGPLWGTPKPGWEFDPDA